MAVEGAEEVMAAAGEDTSAAEVSVAAIMGEADMRLRITAAAMRRPTTAEDTRPPTLLAVMPRRIMADTQRLTLGDTQRPTTRR